MVKLHHKRLSALRGAHRGAASGHGEDDLRMFHAEGDAAACPGEAITGLPEDCSAPWGHGGLWLSAIPNPQTQPCPYPSAWSPVCHETVNAAAAQGPHCMDVGKFLISDRPWGQVRKHNRKLQFLKAEAVSGKGWLQ